MSSFWEKRRAGVAAEEAAEAEAIERAELLRQQAEIDALPDEEVLARYELQDPDTLDSPEAVKEFLAHSLPQRLKNRALRRLWRLNPVLANVDGLVDYGEDYTDAACVMENLQTAYQVGKGMLAHIEAMASEPCDTEAADDDLLADAAEEQNEQEQASLIADVEPASAYEFEDENDDVTPPLVRRRMSFQFGPTA